MDKLFFSCFLLLLVSFPAKSQEIYRFPSCHTEYCTQVAFVNTNFDFHPDSLSPNDDRFVFCDDFAYYVNTAWDYLEEHDIKAQTIPTNTSLFMIDDVAYTWPANMTEAHRMGSFVFCITDSLNHNTTMVATTAINIGLIWTLDENGRWQNKEADSVIFLELKK